MSIYVHIAHQCCEDAKKYSQDALLENTKKRVEETQALIGFDQFSPTDFYKKSFGRDFRLIAHSASVDGDLLLLCLRVFPRGSKDYDEFIRLIKQHDKGDQAKKKFLPYTDEDLQQIHAQLSAKPPVQPLPAPSTEEQKWLYEVHCGGDAKDETLVLETDAWVSKMRSSEMRDYLALYHQVVEQLDLDELPPSSTNADCRIYWGKSDRSKGIAYVYRPDFRRLLLLEPVRQDKSQDIEKVLDEHRKKLSGTAEDTAEALSRVAGRSYPYLMVLDQGAWLKIQKDEEANLALSPEEAELLESVRKTGVGDRLGYPLFINGRAGSGKSTMLQYLAADYVEFSLKRSDGLKPIYMTYSRDLLERAKQTVKGLLTTHHERLLEGAPDSSKIDALLSDSFVVFHEFLYSLLTPEDKERFAPECRVTYAEFRRLWAKEFGRRPEAKHMSPDLAWHTIRSYIKGRRSTSDDDLDPKEFEALPRRQLSVSLDTYRQVYEQVWCRWYKRLCEEQGYWDDQDLAARVLESSSSGAAQLPSFGAVFCDEAQDFTPLELEIIFQLSLFSRRSLSPQDLQRVPIAFAGDPLQTIKPTGFCWEAVKADFHDRFQAVLDPRRRTNVEINYRGLQFNYRSNPGIVRFCNLIQLIRAACLGDRDVRPQKVWWVDDPMRPVWFSVEDANTQQMLPQQQQQSELVKLVNCEEGEESDYAGKDEILKTLDQKDGVFRNVLGPMRAKGLEFPAVVLYRFAETAPDGFLDLLTGKLDVSEDPERQLPFQYFLNRLYVAASRAKGQLFVVDRGKEFDNEGFWKFATDFNVVKNLVQRTAKPKDWDENGNHFIHLVKGSEGAWAGQPIDLRKQGEEYAAQGRRNRDPYHMRQAALAFKDAGDKTEAERCWAGAEEFEGKLREAGDRYRESDSFEKAFECYWQGQVFDRICDLKKSKPEYASRLKSRAADFACAAMMCWPLAHFWRRSRRQRKIGSGDTKPRRI